MPIGILKHSLKNTVKKPVEYIGIRVERLAPALSGKINILHFLKNNSPAEVAADVVTSSDVDVIYHVLGKQILSGEKGADIHLIECYQTVSSIFGVPENDLPSPQRFYTYVNSVIKSYEMTYMGILQPKITMPKLAALAAKPVESTPEAKSAAALATKGMYSATAKASGEESKKEKSSEQEDSWRCVIM